MNEDKYKDNYITVVKAIHKAFEENDSTLLFDYINLDLSKESELANIPVVDFKNIILSLQQENFIVVTHESAIKDFLEDKTFQNWSSPTGIHIFL